MVSHSLHVTPYGTSGFGDGAMSVQLSSHVLFRVCRLKSDLPMLFYHLLIFLSSQLQFL